MNEWRKIRGRCDMAYGYTFTLDWLFSVSFESILILSKDTEKSQRIVNRHRAIKTIGQDMND